MDEQDLYLLDEEDLLKIEDLYQGVALAVEKIIRQKGLYGRTSTRPHPAITGLEFMINQVLDHDELEEKLDNVF